VNKAYKGVKNTVQAICALPDERCTPEKGIDRSSDTASPGTLHFAM